MRKQVLVIGGSYFTGRVFSMVSAREAGFSLTLANRGRYSMAHLPGLREFRCDRHDPEGLRALPADHYDAVVDFCAYTPGDVKGLLANLPGQFDRYILLSTADVYDRSIRASKDETTPLLTCQPPAAAGSTCTIKCCWKGRPRRPVPGGGRR